MDMKFRKLGNTGEEVPVMGLGTFGMGGKFKPDRSRDKEVVEDIRTAVEMGYTLIDTAEAYGGGHTEELVGKAIGDFDRDDLFIVSKVSPEHSRFMQVIKAAKASTKRLGTHMDLYLIHLPPKAPLRETMAGMEKVADMGLARHIGVSNFDIDMTSRAMELVTRHPIVANQSEHSLVEHNFPLSDFCWESGITFMAYSPLGRGELLEHPKFGELEEIAKKHGKTAVQAALRWLMDNDALPLVKSENPEHLEENLGAVGWRLGQDWQKLADIFISNKGQ